LRSSSAFNAIVAVAVAAVVRHVVVLLQLRECHRFVWYVKSDMLNL
jgi:hypothetical protein